MASVWSFLKRVYESTSRDVVYAYNGLENYASIDRTYLTSDLTCRYVILIDRSKIGLLNTYIRTHVDLLRERGAIIASLTWLGATLTDSVRLEVARRQYEMDIRNDEEEEEEDGRDDDDESFVNNVATAADDDDDDIDHECLMKIDDEDRDDREDDDYNRRSHWRNCSSLISIDKCVHREAMDDCWRRKKKWRRLCDK